MTARPVAPRAAARRDAERIVTAYRLEAGPQIALGFVGALEAAYAMIGAEPGAGSPRYGLALDLPGLRSWRVRGFPYLVFYVERAGLIDVWRILHGRRDIPETLMAPQDSDEHP
jgi:toxin ParE1/3/4